jgi:hypothetical protein
MKIFPVYIHGRRVAMETLDEGNFLAWDDSGGSHYY